MITRYDTAPINQLTVDSITGFLKAKDVPIARTGVFPYLKADGSIEMEAKLPQELLNDSTIESANSKPITDDHPSESVNAGNSQKYMRGFTADNAHIDNDRIKVDMTITDYDLISEIQKGKQELSIGFQTDVVPVKGTFNGMAYDSVQRNIQINHVAVVKRGRAGHSVRLTGDSAEMIQDDEKKGKSMDFTKVHLADGADVSVATSDAEKITKLDADNGDKDKKIAQLQAENKKLKEDADKAKGKSDDDKKNADEAQAKADSLEKELADVKKKFEGDAFDQAVQDRINLIENAKKFVGDSVDLTGMTPREMKIQAVKSAKAVNDSIDLDTKPDAYVDALFENLNPSKIVGFNGSQFKGDSAEDSAIALRNQRYNLANQGGNN